jgi:NAD dependent epimerase/dehydratase family enzyme
VIPAPAFALRFGLGGVSSILLDSTRVVPQVAERLGYEFRYADAESALQSLLTPK